MESPISRTSSSHSIYAPGPHRRSHPNLQHLSLAPLTPRYPIDPADYLAYHDPTTSNLHTSASISHIASLPSPSGILTNSPARSRNNSRSRLLKRKVKSHVNVVAPADSTIAPSGAVSSAGLGYSGLRPLPQQQQQQQHQQGGRPVGGSKSQTHLSNVFMPDASWLVQTGLALTESSRENKGQSWLGKRDSSTSLVSLVTAPTSPVEERGRGSGPLGGFSPGLTAAGLNAGGFAYSRNSGRATPSRSRGNSRHGSRSRKGSRRFLAMTSAVDTGTLTSPTSPTDERSRATSQQAQTRTQTQTQQPAEEDEIQPDWVDPVSRLEFSSQNVHQQPRHSSEYFSIQEEEDDTVEHSLYDLPDDDDNDEDDDVDDDIYGQLHLDAHFDNGSDIVDEDEVRRELKMRNEGVLGRWFDGVVDAFLMLEDDGEGDESRERGPSDEDRTRDLRNLQALVDGTMAAERNEALEGDKRSDWEDERQDAHDVEPPPEQPQSVWDDVKWLGRLVARSIGS